jgi:hypothetical protein
MGHDSLPADRRRTVTGIEHAPFTDGKVVKLGRVSTELTSEEALLSRYVEDVTESIGLAGSRGPMLADGPGLRKNRAGYFRGTLATIIQLEVFL